ncbi:MAG: class I SAM-dependent methyltransferase [Planctomycetota bacterium]
MDLPDEPSTLRFTDRADDYARYRPGYPGAAIDAILAGMAPPATLAVADVGAGTGISARLLAERGARVTAVEPNAAMRAAAAPHPRVVWVEGTAEATGLPAGSHDLVTVAQAFHWFEVGGALAEFQRVLRRGGRLAIVWNRRSHDDACTAGYRAALQAVGADAPVERSTFDPAVIAATGRFAGLRTHVFANTQVLTEVQLLGRALSTSTVPKEGPRHDDLIGALRSLHAQHRDASGRVALVYRTEVFVWDRTEAGAPQA